MTVGHGVEEFAKSFEEANDDYNAIMAKHRVTDSRYSPSTRTIARREWGYVCTKPVTTS